MGYWTEAIDRICLMEKEAITTVDGIQPVAVPYPTHIQSTYPYWVNKPGQVTVDRTASTEYRTHMLEMSIVIGALTQDYTGENEARANLWLEEVFDYFLNRPMLQRTPHDSQIKFLSLPGALMIGAAGIRYVNAGNGVTQVRLSFDLRVDFSMRVSLVS